MYSSVQSEVRAEATYIKMKIMFKIEKKFSHKKFNFWGEILCFWWELNETNDSLTMKLKLVDIRVVFIVSSNSWQGTESVSLKILNNF